MLMLANMMGINIFFLVNTRFREIEVQVSKNEREITSNIFEKLRATRTFRNVFMIIVTILQVAGTIMLFVEKNAVAKNFQNKNHFTTKTAWTTYGSYLVSISICLMLMGYLVGLIIQYRSLTRLVQFLSPNRYVQSIIFIFSLFVVLVYLCALLQTLVYFWGVAAI